MTSKFDGLIKSMTVSVFASLPSAWPEYLWSGATLIARVHDNCLKNSGQPDVETDVIARVLVEVPEEKIPADQAVRMKKHGDRLKQIGAHDSDEIVVLPAHLARLTIRYCNTEFDYRDLKFFPEEQSYRVSRIEEYLRCLEMIKPLPVLDLHDPFKTWPVEAQR